MLVMLPFHFHSKVYLHFLFAPDVDNHLQSGDLLARYTLYSVTSHARSNVFFNLGMFNLAKKQTSSKFNLAISDYKCLSKPSVLTLTARGSTLVVRI